VRIKNKVKKLLSILACLMLTTIGTQAQTEPEYRLEIGAAAGLAAYQGDLGGSIASGMQPMGAAMAKYKLNPRMCWTLGFGLTQLKGSSKNNDSWMPGISEKNTTFKSSVYDVQLRYEYNFWAFGTGREFYGAKRLTPFIALGTGLVIASAKAQMPDEAPRKENTLALQMPIGMGVKCKLSDRLNLTAEWMMHFTGTDCLDAIYDPYEIRSVGLFKNTDSYSMLQVSVTYDLWVKCKTCHNDKD